MPKTEKIISNIIYVIGIIISVSLIFMCIFGANTYLNSNSDVMIRFSLREQAFIGLAVGFVPMTISCMAVYKFNVIKNSPNKKLYFWLIFLPSFVCGILFLIVAVFLIYVLCMTIINHIEYTSLYNTY